MLGEVLVDGTLLRSPQRLTRLRNRHQNRPNGARPLARLDAASAFGLELSEKGGAFFSLTERGPWLCRH